MRRLAILALTTLALATLPAAAQLGPRVQVRNSFFEPQELRIAVGETVTWDVIDGGHSVTADDGRFDFHQDRLLQRGDTVSWRFDEDETFSYHCKLHRASMFGVIVVGRGSPPPPPTGEAPEVRVVPSEFPSIGDAVRGAPPGTIVELAPGPYREAVRIDVPGMVLRGTGARPEDVAIEGGSSRGIGIQIQADGVAVENLTVRRHTFAGVYAFEVGWFRLDGVILEENKRYGLRALGVRGGVVRDVTARGADTAGVAIESCEACDVIVEDTLAERNLAGVTGLNAGGLVIRRSTFRDNGTGIALKTALSQDEPPFAGAHVHGNLIEGNRNRGIRPAEPSASFDIPTGTGVWLSGAWHALIEANTIRDHLYNVAVTGFAGLSVGHRITGNLVSEADVADLGWDGIGVGVCLADNRAPGGGAATSEPPSAETMYACSLPATAGVPYPVVSARVLAFGA